MSNTKLRSQAKKHDMELIKSTSPKHKRLREVAHDSFHEITPKSLCLNKTDSPVKFLQIMDERFEKLTDQLHATIQNIVQECEGRILTEIDKRLQIMKNDFSELTCKVTALETAVSEIRTKTASEIDNLKSETEALKKEIFLLKNCVRKQENSKVACDMRIVGVPKQQGENLLDIHSNICKFLNVCSPEVKDIFRVPEKRTKDGTNKTSLDPAIIVKYKTAYDRNFMMKSITTRIKQNGVLRLNLIGFEGTSPFYANENLTPENHRISMEAHRLKKRGILKSVFTNRGLIYVKRNGSDISERVCDISALHNMFLPHCTDVVDTRQAHYFFHRDPLLSLAQ